MCSTLTTSYGPNIKKKEMGEGLKELHLQSKGPTNARCCRVGREILIPVVSPRSVLREAS